MVRRPAGLSKSARRWLHAEAAYLAERNPKAALAFIEQIDDARGRLGEFPDSGPPGPRAGTRKLVVAPYVLTYRRRGASLEIIDIRHGRQAGPDDPTSTSPPTTEDS